MSKCRLTVAELALSVREVGSALRPPPGALMDDPFVSSTTSVYAIGTAFPPQ